jgi:hypothetical protein
MMLYVLGTHRVLRDLFCGDRIRNLIIDSFGKERGTVKKASITFYNLTHKKNALKAFCFEKGYHLPSKESLSAPCYDSKGWSWLVILLCLYKRPPIKMSGSHLSKSTPAN